MIVCRYAVAVSVGALLLATLTNVVHSICNEQNVAFKIDNVDVITNFYKADGDENEYRGLVFPNKLQVLLISDPKSKKGAMAMSVGVGSMQDDSRLQGEAHFVEHMSFLGTEKVSNPFVVDDLL
jgi:hypothetical protein